MPTFGLTAADEEEVERVCNATGDWKLRATTRVQINLKRCDLKILPPTAKSEGTAPSLAYFEDDLILNERKAKPVPGYLNDTHPDLKRLVVPYMCRRPPTTTSEPRRPSSKFLARRRKQKDRARNRELKFGLTRFQRKTLEDAEGEYDEYMQLYSAKEVTDFKSFRDFQEKKGISKRYDRRIIDGLNNGQRGHMGKEEYEQYKKAFEAGEVEDLATFRIFQDKQSGRELKRLKKAGVPRGQKIILDGLAKGERTFLNLVPGRYKMYKDLFDANGGVYNMVKFQEFCLANPNNFYHPKTHNKDDGLTPAQRCRAKRKKEHFQQIKAGVHASQTRLGKDRKKAKIHKGTQVSCKYCKRSVNRGDLKRHVDKVHGFCSTRWTPPSAKDIKKIEEKTKSCSNHDAWLQERRGRITGTTAGRIFRLTRGNPYNIAKGILKRGGSGPKSIWQQRGIDLEPIAVEAYERFKGVKATYPVGFCIHPKKGIYGATPDAFIGSNGLLEVKCPKDPINEIPRRPNSRFLKYFGKGPRGMELKRYDPYYYQVVMQIVCTGREYCDFAVFYRDDSHVKPDDLWVERITREEALKTWKKMEKKLDAFYNDNLGPKP